MFSWHTCFLVEESLLLAVLMQIIMQSSEQYTYNNRVYSTDTAVYADFSRKHYYQNSSKEEPMNEMLVLEKNGEENLILDYYAYIHKYLV